MFVEDQMGQTVYLPQPPQRIISLVPSQTELLFDLGLDEQVVGVTQFCVRPKEKCAAKPVVGGTKQFNFERIDELEPDLILGNKEENYREGIALLSEQYPVWMSDVLNLKDALAMIQSVGYITDREEEAQELVRAIPLKFAELPRWGKVRAAYLIWRKPYRVAGHKTFAHEMMVHAGFVNALGHLPRYPEVSAAQIKKAKPDILLLASEPFPFSEKYLPEFSERFPELPVALVKGDMFTWFGSRLLRAPAYFRRLREQIRPLVGPLPLPLPREDAEEQTSAPADDGAI